MEWRPKGVLVVSGKGNTCADIHRGGQICPALRLLQGGMLQRLHFLLKRQCSSLIQIIRAAIDQMVSRSTNKERTEITRRARDIWKNREDLPNFGEMRGELDRGRSLERGRGAIDFSSTFERR